MSEEEDEKTRGEHCEGVEEQWRRSGLLGGSSGTGKTTEGMFPFQYVRELVVYLRGLPGASGYGSTTTAEQVTEGLDLQAYTAIVTGKVQQNRKTKNK